MAVITGKIFQKSHCATFNLLSPFLSFPLFANNLWMHQTCFKRNKLIAFPFSHYYFVRPILYVCISEIILFSQLDPIFVIIIQLLKSDCHSFNTKELQLERIIFLVIATESWNILSSCYWNEVACQWRPVFVFLSIELTQVEDFV